MATTIEKPARESLAPNEVLCDHCSAKCCKYFALPIETPVDQEDFDFIRWYVLHDLVTVFAEDDDWYIMVHTTCRHLQSNHLCGIYETRPQICRDYNTENCEYEDNWTYDKYFETAEQVQEYADAVLQLKVNGSIRSAPPDPLPILGEAN
ncbi:MAG: YkgJ family cysteine cluster protein [Planctomycetota bacterium]|nr:YkgJ family cysteine cluster protein [Planctomycetota bacterium]